MTTPPSAGEALPDHDELERALRAGDSLGAASEAHGMLCGMLCARREPPVADWLEQVLGHPPSEASAAAEEKLLVRLHAATAPALDDAEYGFSPLLPDDESGMSARLLALRDWCEGFLFGFGALVRQEPEDLESDLREFVLDLREFCRLEVSEPARGEAAEQDYVQLVEYLRVGTLSARQECLAREP